MGGAGRHLTVQLSIQYSEMVRVDFSKFSLTSPNYERVSCHAADGSVCDYVY